MAKRAKQPDTIGITMEIEDHLAHYAFGAPFRFDDRPQPELSEMLSLTLWGTVVSPKEKAGRDIQIGVSEHEQFTKPMRLTTANAPALRIGELQWAARRVASLYLPPGTWWPFALGVQSGLITRVMINVEPPLRGTVSIVGMHALTRKLVLDIGGRQSGGEAEA